MTSSLPEIKLKDSVVTDYIRLAHSPPKTKGYRPSYHMGQSSSYHHHYNHHHHGNQLVNGMNTRDTRNWKHRLGDKRRPDALFDPSWSLTAKSPSWIDEFSEE
jgi:hypothetical protein